MRLGRLLFIVLDDVGFGQLGCYGSPIETPDFDALAGSGVRCSNMHRGAVLAQPVLHHHRAQPPATTA